jgi:hypothetical protein
LPQIYPLSLKINLFTRQKIDGYINKMVWFTKKQELIYAKESFMRLGLALFLLSYFFKSVSNELWEWISDKNMMD